MIENVDKLKPCPSCGGKAFLIRVSSRYASGDNALCDEWRVSCKTCGLSTRAFNDKIYREISGTLIVAEDGVLKAKSAWNRRPLLDEC